MYINNRRIWCLSVKSHAENLKIIYLQNNSSICVFDIVPSIVAYLTNNSALSLVSFNFSAYVMFEICEINVALVYRIYSFVFKFGCSLFLFNCNFKNQETFC